MNLDVELSQDEIDELSDFLLSDALPSQGMDIVALDGFLTAMAIGPVLIAPERWMRHIGGGEEPVFDSPMQATWFMERVARLFNTISSKLVEQPPRFEPMLYSEEVEGQTHWIADSWCSGFMAAVKASIEDWLPLLNDRTNTDLLAPMFTLGTPEGEEAVARLSDPEAKRSFCGEMLGECVVRINEFWRGRSKVNGGLRAGPRTPRNAPCPCGSGRKYTSCCGA